MRRVAILFSGRGSNMRSLAAHIARDDVPAEIVLTICNRPDAAGIEFARTLLAPCQVIDHKLYENREAFENEMKKHLRAHNVELICAAGFMRLLTQKFVEQWHRQIINIHPSLLPKYKGLHTHEAVLMAGEKEHGCTVHYMTAEMDDGPIIVQKSLRVADDDTADTLAARVLELEHIAYAEALDKILTD